MKTCPNGMCTVSDQAHNNNDKYCWKCGCRLSSPKICVCGKYLDINWDYCPKCSKCLIKREA